MISGSGTFGTNQSQQNCTYTYNAIGNLTDKCGAVLSYSDANHPSAVTNHSGLSKNYSYDANGNMLARGNQTLTWDIDNRVSSIAIAGGGSTSMEYDYAGVRVKKNAPGGTTIYPFAGYEIDPNGVITKFIRIGIENFASKRGTNKYFYHNDHLGSVNVITDIAGTRVQLNEYDPWGSVSRTEGTIDPTHRFTGQKLDPESGLYYYGGRYYDAETGRFVSADPFVQTPLDPQNLNRYSYVVNNPQNYIDPDGYFHRHKKKGGFFNSIFGKIFRIVFNLAFIAAGLPPGADFGFGLGTAFALGDIGHSLAGIQSDLQNRGLSAAAPDGSLDLFSGLASCRAGDDFCGASPVLIKFPIPVVPGAGSARGEFFIGSPAALGLRGDARDFDPAPNPTRSRAFFNLDFETGSGTFQVNPTCAAAVQVCRSALTIGQGNIVNVGVRGNTVGLSGAVRNSFDPFGIGPAIDFNLSITANSGGILARGVIDPFPSFELTRTVGGSTQFLFRSRESNPICLTGICGSVTVGTQ